MMLCGRSLVRWRKESGALAGCARADCCSRPREPAAGKDVLFAGLGETALRGIVVFSSLTPHMTGPNTTNDVPFMGEHYLNFGYVGDGVYIRDVHLHVLMGRIVQVVDVGQPQRMPSFQGLDYVRA
ncbi:MAG: hypothetical protein IIC21_06285 [Chloroflexi bacterium]|nr:hypothetical protein [Chloroflexota bacterium]